FDDGARRDGARRPSGHGRVARARQSDAREQLRRRALRDGLPIGVRAPARGVARCELGADPQWRFPCRRAGHFLGSEGSMVRGFVVRCAVRVLLTCALWSVPGLAWAQSPENPGANTTTTTPAVNFGIVSFLQYDAEL